MKIKEYQNKFSEVKLQEQEIEKKIDVKQSEIEKLSIKLEEQKVKTDKLVELEAEN